MNKSRLLRLALAAPLTGGVLVILMMFAAGPRINWTFAILAIVGLFLLGLQTWANYYLAMNYQDVFCA